MNATVTIDEMLAMRNALASSQRELYMSAATNINMRTRDLLKNDFGMTLLKNCVWDTADAIVNRFFNYKDFRSADLYISPQQMYERIVHFSYDDRSDPLASNASFRKMLYENKNGHAALEEITQRCFDAQTKLFEKEEYITRDGKKNSKYIDKALIDKGKANYSNKLQKKYRVLSDEITGVSKEDGFDLECDHVRPVAAATYDARFYKTSESIEQLKELYNSDDNFQMLFCRANRSKGDVRVFSDGNKIISETTLVKERSDLRKQLKAQYIEQGMSKTDADKKASTRAKEITAAKYADITYKATAKQYADAVCDRLENAKKDETLEKLRESKFLDENNKVTKEARKRLEDKVRQFDNAESIHKLKTLAEQNFDPVTDEAFEYTTKAFKNIVAGQVVYYVLPPLVFETQTLISKKGMNLDRFFREIKQSGKRVVVYVKSKLGEMFKNIAGNTLNKFLKSFFDILIEAVKETVKRLLKIIKQVVLSLVNCIKIIGNKNTSDREKADAVTKTLAVTISSVVLEVLFEWLEDQYGIPDVIMEPLQIIVTIITTNLIMLILEKADLFDVRYGLLVANIERIFDEEYDIYQRESEALMLIEKDKLALYTKRIQSEIGEIEQSIASLNLYEEDVSDNLNQINEIFDMGIDFNKEWLDFCKIPCGGI